MSLNSGKGEVLSKNVPLSEVVTDMILAQGKDCFNYWLIAPSLVDSTFLAFNINEQGIQAPIHSTGFESYWKNVDNDLYHSAPYLMFNPDYSKLVSIRYQDNKYDQPGDSTFLYFRKCIFLGFDIYDFNSLTGKINNRVFIPENYPDGIFNWISSLCFSPDGRRLYKSRVYLKELKSMIKYELSQYDFTLLPDTFAFKNSVHILDTISRNNAMRLAPDGKIYLTHDGNEAIYYGKNLGSFFGTDFINCIHHPNEIGDTCHFESAAIYYPPYAEFPVGNSANKEPSLK